MKIAKSFKADSVYMGRFERGTDIIRSLEAFCREKGITAAWINVIGALEQATISYYDQKDHTYFHKELKGDYEIVSCSGNISLKDGQPFAHLHIVLSGTDYGTLGGHLWPDTVQVFAAEFVVFQLTPDVAQAGTDGSDSALIRCPDADTGLALW
jgi:predicted DNA-binding protein with PD1-like motif